MVASRKVRAFDASISARPSTEQSKHCANHGSSSIRYCDAQEVTSEHTKLSQIAPTESCGTAARDTHFEMGSLINGPPTQPSLLVTAAQADSRYCANPASLSVRYCDAQDLTSDQKQLLETSGSRHCGTVMSAASPCEMDLVNDSRETCASSSVRYCDAQDLPSEHTQSSETADSRHCGTAVSDAAPCEMDLVNDTCGNQASSSVRYCDAQDLTGEHTQSSETAGSRDCGTAVSDAAPCEMDLVNDTCVNLASSSVRYCDAHDFSSEHTPSSKTAGSRHCGTAVSDAALGEMDLVNNNCGNPSSVRYCDAQDVK